MQKKKLLHTCFGQVGVTRCAEVDGPLGVYKQLVVARYETGKVAGFGPLHQQHQGLWGVAGWGIRRLFSGQAISIACSCRNTSKSRTIIRIMQSTVKHMMLINTFIFLLISWCVFKTSFWWFSSSF